MLIDTHAHLTYDTLKDNLPEILSSFKDNNIEAVFTVGYNLASSIECVKLAESYDNIYAIAGIHPSDVFEATSADLERLEKLAQHPKCIAIGETGLDFHYYPYDQALQEQYFVKHLEIAYRLNLPVVIHVRDAYDALVAVLEKNMHLLKFGGLVHCFSGDINFFNQIKKYGLKISVGGAITFKNATALVETIKCIDITDIVLETDCPYLTPVPFRGREINQPKYVSLVAEKLAEIKGLSLQEVMNITTKTAKEIFRI